MQFAWIGTYSKKRKKLARNKAHSDANTHTKHKTKTIIESKSIQNNDKQCEFMYQYIFM